MCIVFSWQKIGRLYSATLEGIDAKIIEIEADVNVGLRSLNEVKERVSSVLKNFGIKPPNRENRKITINLAPADIKKTGSHYDLAIAIGYLLATKQIREFECADKLFLGELALDGRLRPVSGALNIAEKAARDGFKYLFLPQENANEAAAIEGIKVIGGGPDPRPGEISLAHRGILFLDELPEFQRNALEALRQPLESGVVHLARAKQSVTFPARFILVAAMNPCPCGFYGDTERECKCSAYEIIKIPEENFRAAARPHRPPDKGGSRSDRNIAKCDGRCAAGKRDGARTRCARSRGTTSKIWKVERRTEFARSTKIHEYGSGRSRISTDP